MTLRSFFIALLGVVLVLLSIAGGGVAWVLAQSPLNLNDGGVQATPTAAMFIPKQSPLMVSLLVNPTRLESLVQVGTPLGERARTRQELDRLKAGLLAQTGLDYRRDIQGWLGEEMTVAITSLDYDRNPDNGAQMGYLLAVAAKDGERAREFLQILYAKGAIAGQADLVFEQYKGVNLIYRQARNGQGANLASAVVGDRYVLFANDPKVLRDAINNVQVPPLNLAQSEAYQQALAPINRPRIGVAYLNLLAVAKAFDTEPTDPIPTVTFAFGLSPAGLIADTAVAGIATEEAQPPTLTAPVTALQYLPPKTSFTAAGTDLNQFWEQITTSLGEDSPVVSLLTTALAQFTPDLDPTEAIFPWVTGDYALSVLPNRDWVFVARNTEQTPAALEALDTLAAAQNLTISTLSIQDQPVTAWAELAATGGQITAQVQGAYATIDDYLVLSNSLNVVSNVVRSRRANLAQSRSFQAAIAPLPTPNNGLLYLNWPQVRPLITEKFPVIKVIEVAAKPVLEHVRSLSLTSTGQTDGISRATLLFNLSLF